MPPPQPNPDGEQVYDLDDLDADGLTNPSRSILIVEDSVDFAEMLQLFLEGHSYRVKRVATGVEGVREIMASDFDLILCDLVMPNLPGDMFYLAVQRTKPHLCKRFLFMTSHQAEAKWRDFIRSVNGAALWKPFLLPDLLTAIKTVLLKS